MRRASVDLALDEPRDLAHWREPLGEALADGAEHGIRAPAPAGRAHPDGGTVIDQARRRGGRADPGVAGRKIAQSHPDRFSGKTI